MLSDLLLFSRIKKGDIKSFETIFRKYYLSLYYYSISILKNADSAEEIVQQLFYTVWLNKEDITIQGSLNNYFYKSVLNQSLQHLKRNSTKLKHENYLKNELDSMSYSTPQDEIEYKELDSLVTRIIAKLPERRRTIYLMHKEGGLKYKDIAQELSLSIKTIEAEMTKTYKELRIEIDKYINNYEILK